MFFSGLFRDKDNSNRLSSGLILMLGVGALLLASLSLFSSSSFASPSSSAFVEFEKVSSRRVGRTIVEFEYRAKAVNGARGVSGVSAVVTSSAGSTVIVDGALSFPDMAAGEEAFSTNTFTFRQNRRVRFDPAVLSLVFDFDFVNTRPLADAGDDQSVSRGNVVVLDGSGESPRICGFRKRFRAIPKPHHFRREIQNPWMSY